MKLVSIIMPMYNAEKYVSHALDSLIVQTYKNIEILAIDDGSTDGSMKILKNYASRHARVKIVALAKNSGVGTARNAGLDAAKGEYIMFLDSDDWHNPDMVEKMVSAMERRGADLVVCLANLYDDAGALPEIFEKIGTLNKQESLEKDGTLDMGDARREISSVVWDKIFRKSAIDRHGLRFPDGWREHEDTLFVREYLLVSESLYVLKERLCNHVLRDGSITGEARAGNACDKYGYLRLSEALLEFCRRKGMPPAWQNDLAYFTMFGMNFLATALAEKEFLKILRRTNRLFEDTPSIFMYAYRDYEPMMFMTRTDEIDKIPIVWPRSVYRDALLEKWRRKILPWRSKLDPTSEFVARMKRKDGVQ